MKKSDEANENLISKKEDNTDLNKKENNKEIHSLNNSFFKNSMFHFFLFVKFYN